MADASSRESDKENSFNVICQQDSIKESDCMVCRLRRQHVAWSQRLGFWKECGTRCGSIAAMLVLLSTNSSYQMRLVDSRWTAEATSMGSTTYRPNEM
jgi:hypothetical protein